MIDVTCHISDMRFYMNKKATICTKTIRTVKLIATHSKILLKDLIQTYADQNFHEKHLDHNTWWDVTYDSISITFIDLIKGVVPLELVERIKLGVKDQQLMNIIVSIFFDFIFNNIRDHIWRPRCDKQIEIEQKLNIKRKDKRTKSRKHSDTVTNTNICINSNQQVNFIDPSQQYNSLQASIDSIIFGGVWPLYV
jgi:hypothetical protein